MSRTELTQTTAAQRTDLSRYLGPALAKTSNLAAQFGDSRVAQGFTTSPGTYQRVKQQNGYQMWLEAYSDLKWRCPYDLNFGVAGDKTTQMLVRVDAAIAAAVAAGAQSVIIHAPVNDRTDSGITGPAITLEQSQTNMTAIITAWLEAGFTVFLTNETPRQGFPSTQQAVWHVAMHEWLTRYALSTTGVVLVDTWAAFTNPATTLADSTSDLRLTANYRDTVHYTSRGAQVLGQVLATAMAPYAPPSCGLVAAAADLYSTDFPHGNLVPKGTFLGTTGSGGGGGLAGAWTGQTNNGTGLTVNYSKGTNGLFDTQRVVISGTPSLASPSVLVYCDSFLSNLTEGDELEGLIGMKLAASATGVSSIDFDVQASGGDASSVGRPDADDTAARITSAGFDWLPFATPKWVTPAVGGITTARARVVIRMVQNEAVSLTLDLQRCSVRKLN